MSLARLERLRGLGSATEGGGAIKCIIPGVGDGVGSSYNFVLFIQCFSCYGLYSLGQWHRKHCLAQLH